MIKGIQRVSEAVRFHNNPHTTHVYLIETSTGSSTHWCSTLMIAETVKMLTRWITLRKISQKSMEDVPTMGMYSPLLE